MIGEYIPEVVQAVPGEGYSVYAYFSDGKITLYDVEPLLRRGGVFESLKDSSFFRERLTVMNDTVAWNLGDRHDPKNCIDIDPFEIYQAESVRDPLETAG